MKKNLLFGGLLLLILGACRKETVAPQTQKPTTFTAQARVAGDNYDRADMLSIVKRVNELNPTHCTPAARIAQVHVACWTLDCTVGWRHESEDGSGGYQCPDANSYCDIVAVHYTGKIILSDGNGGTTEENWNNVEVMKKGDVIVCTDGDPSYYENSHVEVDGAGNHRVVKN